jgi:hypothetical protein
MLDLTQALFEARRGIRLTWRLVKAENYFCRPSNIMIQPGSAVPADAMSEEQTLRSEVNESLPLSGHRSSVVQDEI